MTAAVALLCNQRCSSATSPRPPLRRPDPVACGITPPPHRRSVSTGALRSTARSLINTPHVAVSFYSFEFTAACFACCALPIAAPDLKSLDMRFRHLLCFFERARPPQCHALRLMTAAHSLVASHTQSLTQPRRRPSPSSASCHCWVSRPHTVAERAANIAARCAVAETDADLQAQAICR